jgi:NADPH:quinone reductase-like Zn-dependent oxidoreductase
MCIHAPLKTSLNSSSSDGDVTPAIKATGLGAPIDGVLREYIVVPVHSLVKIPQHLSFEEASTLPCAALTAYNALYGPKPLARSLRVHCGCLSINRAL